LGECESGKKKTQIKRKKKMALWGIFTTKVPFFDHRIQGSCFCYLPNTQFKWNKFKWEIFDNSNYDNFHGGGDFSRAYVIMHKYFGKKKKYKKKVHTFLCIA
jgi:hypothetical protein